MGVTTAATVGVADGKAATAVYAELPLITDPQAVASSDARRMTWLFLQRLDQLEEGTAAYGYARDTLIELCLPLVSFAAKRFHQREEHHEDIWQVGTVGLIKAIDRFDVSRNIGFTSFAIPYITGEIKRFFRDTTWAVHVPRRLQEQRMALARATEQLEARLGRSPSTGELAEAMELSAEEVTEARVAANGYVSRSLDFPGEGEGDADATESGTLLSHLGGCDPALEKVEDLNALKPLLAGLEERDRRILQMHFGEGLTQQQIGKSLGLSQMHISRLLRKCLEGLRTAMTQE